VQRLSIHRDDWDDIPHRLTTDEGHVIRVDWFTTIPRHTVSVTAAGKYPITLLLVSPSTADNSSSPSGSTDSQKDRWSPPMAPNMTAAAPSSPGAEAILPSAPSAITNHHAGFSGRSS
jgi:hypothetical protein